MLDKLNPLLKLGGLPVLGLLAGLGLGILAYETPQGQALIRRIKGLLPGLPSLDDVKGKLGLGEDKPKE